MKKQVLTLVLLTLVLAGVLFGRAWYNGTPLGKIVYVGTDNQVWMIYLDSGRRLQVSQKLTSPDEQFSDPRWSPDGKSLAFWGGDRGLGQDALAIFLTDPKTKEPHPLASNRGGKFDWSPDGQSLVSANFDLGYEGSDVGLYRVKLDDSEPEELVPTKHNKALMEPLYSPDGKWISFHTFCYECLGQFSTYRVETGERIDWIKRDSKFQVGNIDWSPDSSRIAFDTVISAYLKPGATAELYTASPDGSNVAPLFSSSGEAAVYPLWSPDGKQIAFSILAHSVGPKQKVTSLARLVVLDPASGKLKTLVRSETELKPLVWLPGGKGILYARLTDDYPTACLSLIEMDKVLPTELVEMVYTGGVDWAPEE